MSHSYGFTLIPYVLYIVDMDIKRHRNGTFTITDMSKVDMENLYFGIITAEAWQVTSGHGTAARGSVFARLGRAVKYVIEVGTQTSVKLVSADYNGTEPYEVAP